MMCNAERGPPCRGKRTGGPSLARLGPTRSGPGEIHVPRDASRIGVRRLYMPLAADPLRAELRPERLSG